MNIIYNKQFLLWTYFLVAGICFLQAIPPGERVSTMRRRLWLAMGIILVLGIIDHQMAIGFRLANVGRRLALSEGWYETRRKVQAITILFMAIAWICIAVAVLRHARKGGWASWLAMLSCLFLLGFTSIRTISLHHIDAWLNGYIFGIQRSYFFEWLGIIAIAFAATMNQMHKVIPLKRKSQE